MQKGWSKDKEAEGVPIGSPQVPQANLCTISLS